MEMYTTKEAATYLGKSVRTLRRWLRSGKLVPEKKGDIGRGKCDIFSIEQLKNVTCAETLVKAKIEHFAK